MGQGQRSRGSRSNKGSKQRQVGSRQHQVASFYICLGPLGLIHRPLRVRLQCSLVCIIGNAAWMGSYGSVMFGKQLSGGWFEAMSSFKYPCFLCPAITYCATPLKPFPCDLQDVPLYDTGLGPVKNKLRLNPLCHY